MAQLRALGYDYPIHSLLNRVESPPRMYEKLVLQIKSDFSLLDTDELLEIWVENDETRWPPEAFDAVRQVLAERRVEMPNRKELNLARSPTVAPNPLKESRLVSKYLSETQDSSILKGMFALLMTMLAGILLYMFIEDYRMNKLRKEGGMVTLSECHKLGGHFVKLESGGYECVRD